MISVVNVTESSIARESDLALPILAGPEIGVASTKAFTCQLMVLALIALKAAQDRGTLSADEVAAHLEGLRTLPGLAAHALNAEGAVEAVARRLGEAQDVLFLGRGAMYAAKFAGSICIGYVEVQGESLEFCTHPAGGSMTCGSLSNGTISSPAINSDRSPGMTPLQYA